MRAAILDFGTNTFNLLVAESSGNTFHRIYTGKEPVKIGKGGIHRRTITPEAEERAMNAIANHMATIREMNVDGIYAYATSAFRNASNGNEIASKIEERFGFKVMIIPGEEEAELIYRGIKASVSFDQEKAMIMDIGGGSNELIICDASQMYWKHSFELGMARILEQFRLSDPVSPGEIDAIENFYRDSLGLLFHKQAELRATKLIGASGSFDTLAAMIRHRKGYDPEKQGPMEIGLTEFEEIKELILGSTIEERRAMQGMEPVRVEMIIPATIFINLVLRECSLKSIIQSDYALKEGVMSTLIEK